MAITFDEIPGSAQISTGSAKLKYLMAGQAGDTQLANRITAYALALGSSPVLFGSLFRSSVELTEKGPLLYEVDVDYGTSPNKEPEAGNFKWAFDTTGGTKHITHAKEHIASHVKSGGTVEEHNGAIGWKEGGEVEGVDVPDRAFKWTETHQLLLADFGFTYASILGDYSGWVNSSTFRGKSAYCVMFGGGVGGPMDEDPDLCEITYHFEYQPTATNFTIGTGTDAITIASKIGWDVLSICYTSKEGTKGLSVKPKQVDVDRVFDDFDFSLLGIGTT